MHSSISAGIRASWDQVLLLRLSKRAEAWLFVARTICPQELCFPSSSSSSNTSLCMGLLNPDSGKVLTHHQLDWLLWLTGYHASSFLCKSSTLPPSPQHGWSSTQLWESIRCSSPTQLYCLWLVLSHLLPDSQWRSMPGGPSESQRK